MPNVQRKYLKYADLKFQDSAKGRASCIIQRAAATPTMNVYVNSTRDNMAKKQMLIYLTNNMKMIICILNCCIKGESGEEVELNGNALLIRR